MKTLPRESCCKRWNPFAELHRKQNILMERERCCHGEQDSPDLVATVLLGEVQLGGGDGDFLDDVNNWAGPERIRVPINTSALQHHEQ